MNVVLSTGCGDVSDVVIITATNLCPRIDDGETFCSEMHYIGWEEGEVHPALYPERYDGGRRGQGDGKESLERRPWQMI